MCKLPQLDSYVCSTQLQNLGVRFSRAYLCRNGDGGEKLSKVKVFQYRVENRNLTAPNSQFPTAANVRGAANIRINKPGFASGVSIEFGKKAESLRIGLGRLLAEMYAAQRYSTTQIRTQSRPLVPGNIGGGAAGKLRRKA